MPFDVINRRYYVEIAGNPIRIAPSSLIINATLDGLTRVAEFALAYQPVTEPEELDTVTIQLVDVAAEEAAPLFGGRINAIDTSSSPWSMIVRCTDQLEKLRRVATTDHDLTGMTDGEAIQHILDACDIDYDPADIGELGIILGNEVPVLWPALTTGGTVLQDIDGVLGYTTQTVGNNRVIRFRVDLPPVNATGKYRDYEKGVDADWPSHGRSHGERDSIQNWWTVRGVSAPCGTNEECTCQPWANAFDVNPQLGGSRRLRVTPAETGSDIIQDEEVAEYVVRMLMRRHNRLKEEAVVTALDDPSVNVGTKLGLIDNTYGITTGAIRLGTVTSVDRADRLMSLTLTCGDPGEEGTVTTGVDKACNDTHTNPDWPNPDGFDPLNPPDFDFPPPIGFDPIDLGDFVIPAGRFVVGGTDPAAENYLGIGIHTFHAWVRRTDSVPPTDWVVNAQGTRIEFVGAGGIDGALETVRHIPISDDDENPVSFEIRFTVTMNPENGLFVDVIPGTIFGYQAFHIFGVDWPGDPGSSWYEERDAVVQALPATDGNDTVVIGWDLSEMRSYLVWQGVTYSQEPAIPWESEGDVFIALDPTSSGGSPLFNVIVSNFEIEIMG